LLVGECSKFCGEFFVGFDSEADGDTNPCSKCVEEFRREGLEHPPRKPGTDAVVFESVIGRIGLLKLL
jgi:hypothetical protein